MTVCRPMIIMGRLSLPALLILCGGFASAWAQDAAEKTAPGRPIQGKPRCRIAVLIRESYERCINEWAPIADALSEQIPEYRFAVVPIASHDDLSSALEDHDAAFLIVNPPEAMWAERRAGARLLATMRTRGPDGDTAHYGGLLVVRADDESMRTIRDVRGRILAASKPSSFGSWGMQHFLLLGSGIDPNTDLQEVVFAGSPTTVVELLRNGQADVGAVDAEAFQVMIDEGDVDADEYRVLDRNGAFVDVSAPIVPSTRMYPQWAFLAASDTSAELAGRVLDVLLKETPPTNVSELRQLAGWEIPANYEVVRDDLALLFESERETCVPESLVGRVMAGDRVSQRGALLFAAMCAVAIVAILALRNISRQRSGLERRLETVDAELVETRAEKRYVEAILSTTGTGMDVVDADHNLHYVDLGMERQRGDWRGLKCHEYYFGVDHPCKKCRMLEAFNTRLDVVMDIEEGHRQSLIIGVPYHDETGRHLFARLHLNDLLAEELRELKSKVKPENEPAASS